MKKNLIFILVLLAPFVSIESAYGRIKYGSIKRTLDQYSWIASNINLAIQGQEITPNPTGSKTMEKLVNAVLSIETQISLNVPENIANLEFSPVLDEREVRKFDHMLADMLMEAHQSRKHSESTSTTIGQIENMIIELRELEDVIFQFNRVLLDNLDRVVFREAVTILFANYLNNDQYLSKISAMRSRISSSLEEFKSDLASWDEDFQTKHLIVKTFLVEEIAVLSSPDKELVMKRNIIKELYKELEEKKEHVEISTEENARSIQKNSRKVEKLNNEITKVDASILSKDSRVTKKQKELKEYAHNTPELSNLRREVARWALGNYDWCPNDTPYNSCTHVKKKEDWKRNLDRARQALAKAKKKRKENKEANKKEIKKLKKELSSLRGKRRQLEVPLEAAKTKLSKAQENYSKNQKVISEATDEIGIKLYELIPEVFNNERRKLLNEANFDLNRINSISPMM